MLLSKHMNPTDLYRFQQDKEKSLFQKRWQHPMSVGGAEERGEKATEKVDDGLSLGHVTFKLLLMVTEFVRGKGMSLKARSRVK